VLGSTEGYVARFYLSRYVNLKHFQWFQELTVDSGSSTVHEILLIQKRSVNMGLMQLVIT